ncbi:MAG: sugar-binding protein, partial [Kiritimatiellae bacterium]|nr:sugar-binding protein [Kiritimatiellia bacterium]
VYTGTSAKSDLSDTSDKEYRLLRVFGQKGGHQGGRIAPDTLDNPLGISVAGDGTILLSDLGSQRVMVHAPDFGVRKLIHGMMSHQMSVSEIDPSLAYVWWPNTDLWEYRIDPTTRLSEPTRRWVLAQQDANGFGFYRQIFFREWNGRTFIIAPGWGSVVEMAGDRLIPRLKLGTTGMPLLPQTIEDVEEWKPDSKTLAKSKWQWRDINGDGKVQASEYTFFEALTNVPEGRISFGSGYNYVSPKSDIYAACGYHWFGIIKFPFDGLDANGCPIYSWDTAQKLIQLDEPILGLDRKKYDPAVFSAAVDATNNTYLGIWYNPFERPFAPVRLRKYSPAGSLIWDVGEKVTTAWQPGAGLAMPIVGLVDRYLFIIDYYGAMDVWDTDGLFVTRLFDDLPSELQNRGENLGGAAFRHTDGTVYAYIAPDCTYHITGIRVEGLDEIRRFSGTVQVDVPPLARKIEDRTPTWVVLRRTEEILIDGEINPREWGTDTDTQAPQYFLDGGGEVARAWAQWDDEALYLAWKIRDESPAVNRRMGPDRYLSDQIEFMIRASTAEASGGYTPEDFQLAIGPDGEGHLGIFVQLNSSERQESLLEDPTVGLRVNSDKKGYTMEARIPWASLGAYRPKTGETIRWSMNICYGDDLGENLQQQIKWKPGIHRGPANWGKALFR